MRNANLVIGLGNTLMGDDGIGCRVAERLSTDPRLREDTDVVCAGTDLLGCDSSIEGRRHVVIVDAMLDGSRPGVVTVHDDVAKLDDGGQHAHHFSVASAVRVFEAIYPVRFTLVTVAIESAEAGAGLSEPVESAIPEIVDRVLSTLSVNVG